MGIFDMFRTPDINAEVERFRAEPGAALLDVRESDEYAEGHIPGSVNIPLSDIARVEARLPDKGGKYFVYCLSGARSGRAVDYMTAHGYTDVTNIGGLRAYRGRTER